MEFNGTPYRGVDVRDGPEGLWWWVPQNGFAGVAVDRDAGRDRGSRRQAMRLRGVRTSGRGASYQQAMVQRVIPTETGPHAVAAGPVPVASRDFLFRRVWAAPTLAGRVAADGRDERGPAVPGTILAPSPCRSRASVRRSGRERREWHST